MPVLSRRRFLELSGSLAPALLLSGCGRDGSQTPVYGHLWVYASRFPPDWDCTPILDEVFRDFAYAGIEGVEVMESLLRNPDILSRGGEMVERYGIPVVGSSYYADMWRAEERQRILEDVDFVVEKLRRLGGSIFGITVGDARRKKTEAELDAQAETLREVLAICARHEVQPNLHNHTFEVANELHDLKGTLARVPELKLGPDVSWLARAGLDPAAFVREYGDRLVYLHLRDNVADGSFAEAIGDGAIDFVALAEAVSEVGFRGPAAIELAYDGTPQRETRENWRLSRERVREVFGW